jgi:hypothetical protein
VSGDDTAEYFSAGLEGGSILVATAQPADPPSAGYSDSLLLAHQHWASESASWTWLQRLSMRRSDEWTVDRFVPRTVGMMTVSEGSRGSSASAPANRPSS